MSIEATSQDELGEPLSSSASQEELELLRKVRLALSSMLQMLEHARDDLKAMEDRMDRLRVASERCRIALQEKREREEQEFG